MSSHYYELLKDLSPPEQERLRQALRLLIELLLAEIPGALDEPERTRVVPSERPNAPAPADLDAA